MLVFDEERWATRCLGDFGLVFRVTGDIGGDCIEPVGDLDLDTLLLKEWPRGAPPPDDWFNTKYSLLYPVGIEDEDTADFERKLDPLWPLLFLIKNFFENL